MSQKKKTLIIECIIIAVNLLLYPITHSYEVEANVNTIKSNKDVIAENLSSEKLFVTPIIVEETVEKLKAETESMKTESVEAEEAKVETAGEEESIILLRQIKPKTRKYLPKKEVRQRILSETTDMRINTTCGLSKKEFVKLCKSLSKMEKNHDKKLLFAHHAGYIWELEQEYKNVDAIFVCGIMAEESGWGNASPANYHNNFTSQMTIEGKLIHYGSTKECLKATFENLSNNYLKKGGKYYNGTSIAAVNKEYCGGKWDRRVLNCMKTIICADD